MGDDDDHTDKHELMDHLAVHIVLPCFHIASAIILICFVIYMNCDDDISSKGGFRMAIVLLIAQASYFISHAARDLCLHETQLLYAVLRAAALYLFSMQYHTLLCLYFFRLQSVFTGSGQHRVSPRIVVTFYVIMALLVMVEIFTIILFETRIFEQHGLFIMEFVNFVFVLMLICLPMIVFVYKLIEFIVHEFAFTETGLILVLTKLTLLASIATASLIASFSVVVTSIRMVAIHRLSIDDFEIVLTVCFGVNTWINFASVILALSSFNKAYLKLCGYADRQCLKICGKIVRSRRSKLAIAAAAIANGGRVRVKDLVVDTSPRISAKPQTSEIEMAG